MELTNNPQNLIILGNGFDLNLGFTTSYVDFLYSEVYRNAIMHGRGDTSRLFLYLKEKYESEESKKNWIDLELELKQLAIAKNSILNIESFKHFTSCLTVFINQSTEGMYYTDTFVAKFIESVFNKDTIIYNFNYSPTVPKLLESLKLEFNKYQIINIHGSVKNKDIIVGVEDDAVLSEEMVFVKKAAIKSFKPIDHLIDVKKAKSIYFFGHSLGETDSNFFKPLFNELIQKDRTNLIFFHYKEESYNSLIGRLDKLTNQTLFKLRSSHNVRFFNCDFNYLELKAQYNAIL